MLGKKLNKCICYFEITIVNPALTMIYLQDRKDVHCIYLKIPHILNLKNDQVYQYFQYNIYI